MTRPVLLALLVVGAVGLLLTWFLTSYERVETEVEVGPQGEAARNPYLAAARLLEELGADLRDMDDLARLRRPDEQLTQRGTLLLPIERRFMRAPQVESLRSWVRGGGHLIVVATADEDDAPKDLLLEPFGLEIRAGSAERFDWSPDSEADTHHATFRTGTRLLRGEAAPLWSMGVTDGLDAALQLRVGDGRLTILGSDFFMTNDGLGVDDNAALLWWLVRHQHSEGPVWLVRAAHPDGLLSLLVGRAWRALFALCVLLFFGIWAVARRFGPVRDGIAPPRRSLLEHLDATADFLWRMGRSELLVESVRGSVRRQAAQRIAGFGRLDHAEQLRYLAERAALEPAAVHRALSIEPGRDRAAFTEIIRTLSRIRQSL